MGLDEQQRLSIMSLPVRGAWVEMEEVLKIATDLNRRSPCGERGLKFGTPRDNLRIVASLPVRGAWVEMAT